MKDDIFTREYDGLFSVCKEKAKFLTDKGVSEKTGVPKGFDLKNMSIYDSETRELIEKGKQGEYNTLFVLKFNRLYVLDVEDFLNHHFNRTSDKKKFIQYVKYAIPVQGFIKDIIKEAVKDWVIEIEILTKKQDVEINNTSQVIEIPQPPTVSKKEDNKFALKEVKIAYFCLGKRITEENYLSIINKYTSSKSNKILQNPIVKSCQLTSLSEDKTADVKHKKALINAERLLSGIKNENAIDSINQIISTFEDNFTELYE